MSYVDFTYYTDTYKGFKVSSDAFDYYSERATDFINAQIEEPLEGTDITDDVKKCTCALTDEMYLLDNKQELSSEKVGTYSRTFNTTKPQYSNERKLFNIVSSYLSKTGLLYRGICNVY